VTTDEVLKFLEQLSPGMFNLPKGSSVSAPPLTPKLPANF
jgi:hypothetical protein